MATPTHELGPKYQALADAIHHLGALVAKANHAETFEKAVANIAGKMQVGYDQYGNRMVGEELLGACKAINDRIHAEVTAEYRSRRDREVAAIASEMEALRIALPDLAAKACVEIGVTVRTLAEGK